jgi:hypothetical protein
MGGMVIERNRGVVRVGKFEVGNIGTVDLEFELVIIIEDRESRAVRRSEILDGVIEVQLLHLGTGRDGLLDLGDEHVKRFSGEHLTLLGIEVGIIREYIPLVTGRGTTPSDAKLHIMILEGNERKGSLPVLTESKPERVEALVGGATIEITGNRLGRGGRGEGGCDEGGVSRILFIDNLTPHHEFNLGNYCPPVSDSLGSASVIGNKVDIVEHVTLALEADGGHTVVGDVALDDLTLDSLGKISVTFVGGPEERHLGLTDEVHILGSDGYELGNTTRHFII